ncbi:MAG: 23S rRNA (uracil1939-C5)-methyltransferase [Rickettsiales bacterium]|jgi:23S rRNA (uracil1939-C5)-methyltransferase
MTKSTNQIELVISGLSNLGQGFAFDENAEKKRKKIFVSKTMIGDKITAQIIKEKSKFTLANLIKINYPSANRIKAPCVHFDDCGGCSLQHLSLEYYQDFKRKILTETFGRDNIDFRGEIEWNFIPAGMRRRVNFQIDQNKRLGFFRENSNDVVKIDNCLILEKDISALIGPLQALILKIDLKISQIFVTKFDNGIAIILQTNDSPNEENSDLLTEFVKENNIISLAYKIGDNYNLIYQSQIPQLFFGNVKIDSEADIFLQATKTGQDVIIGAINDLVEQIQKKQPAKSLNVVDLYSGIGTYSFAALGVNNKLKIKAFEGVDSMIHSLNKNVAKNNLQNSLQGIVKDLVREPLLAGELQGKQLVIINPPRNGALAQSRQIAKSDVKNIIYISCNPAAFAVDAKILLAEGYKINQIKAIDQFVHSHHLELVAVFEKV